MRIKSHGWTKNKSYFTTTKKKALPNSCNNFLQVKKQVGKVGCPSWYAALRGKTGYCRMLWREHTGIWCKRFWHWTTEQLYWQVLQLTAYRTHYTSILLTAATIEGLQRLTRYLLYRCVIVLCDHVTTLYVSDQVTVSHLSKLDSNGSPKPKM